MKLPFDHEKLNALMENDGVDLLLASTKDNVRYLTGGYIFFFFAHKDAIGVSRYLPMLGYPKGDPGKAFYIGNAMEGWQHEVEPIWVPNIHNNQWHSQLTGSEAAAQIRGLGLEKGTIAVEKGFLPADAFEALREGLPEATFVDALFILEELRSVKSPEELGLLKQASDHIIASIVSVMESTPAGTTTCEIAENIRREETSRGLEFEYCLTCTGPSFNRAPSKARWEKGNILSLDSGGNLRGYLGDLCRMAVIGEPTQLMKDLLSEVQAVQAAGRSAIRAGATGDEIFELALGEQAKCAHKDEIKFLAHGMGMIQHEAPHLTGQGAVPYPGVYASRPLEAGMVLSVETDLKNAEVGFIKLEDTVVVTESGIEAYGDEARDWVVADG
ncbi:MAG: Xaa-Pro peptidase family protein [Nitrospinota bacterium]